MLDLGGSGRIAAVGAVLTRVGVARRATSAAWFLGLPLHFRVPAAGHMVSRHGPPFVSGVRPSFVCHPNYSLFERIDWRTSVATSGSPGEASDGLVMKSGSISAPGMRLGEEK